MRKYKVAVLLWRDHTHFERTKMIRDPKKDIQPTMSIGIIYKETKKYFVLVSDIERFEDRDDFTYTVIFKPIMGIKVFGEVEISTI